MKTSNYSGKTPSREKAVSQNFIYDMMRSCNKISFPSLEASHDDTIPTKPQCGGFWRDAKTQFFGLTLSTLNHSTFLLPSFDP